MTLTAVMLMGAKREPFLGACLASIRDAVDHLIVNDNSGLSEHPNLSVMKASDLYRDGRVTIVPSPFLGFGPCRELCLAEMRKTDESNRWIIFVDCDEVHVPALRLVTRRLLPKLPERIGIVDGYYQQIFQSPDRIQTLDHRNNLMFRFRPEIRWVGQVHEKLEGLAGQRLVLPYRYFHYGYLVEPTVITEKWRFYGSLGDQRSGRKCETPEDFLKEELVRLQTFYGRHPELAMPAIREYQEKNSAWLAEVNDFTRDLPFFSLKSRAFQLKIEAKMRWLLLRAKRQLSDCPEARVELEIY